MSLTLIDNDVSAGNQIGAERHTARGSGDPVRVASKRTASLALSSNAGSPQELTP